MWRKAVEDVKKGLMRATDVRFSGGKTSEALTSTIALARQPGNQATKRLDGVNLVKNLFAKVKRSKQVMFPLVTLTEPPHSKRKSVPASS